MLVLLYDDAWFGPDEFATARSDVEFTRDRARSAEADAVLFHIPDWSPERMRSLPLWRRRTPGRQLWVACSMECDAHYPLLADPEFMSLFDLTMTYRLNADLPSTYAPAAAEFEASLAIDPMARIGKFEPAPIACFVSSGYDHSGRQAYLQALAAHVRIDFYGSFMRNRMLDPDHGRASKLDALSRYKFTAAFENARAPDYVTEKFYEPLLVGSVPIYLGAPNVELFAPGDDCFIDVSAFGDPAELAGHIHRLDRDDGAYGRYHAWRRAPLRPHFTELLALKSQPSIGRLCHEIERRLPPSP